MSERRPRATASRPAQYKNTRLTSPCVRRTIDVRTSLLQIGAAMSEWHTRILAQRVPDDGLDAEDLGQHPVAVLSSAVLRAARHAQAEDQAGFAARARIAVGVVISAEDGTQPAWALPYEEFTALADAVAATCPRPLFETAAACDLLLSCVLDGDQVLATDVLVEPCSRDLSRALLRLAVTGEPDTELLGAEHVR